MRFAVFVFPKKKKSQELQRPTRVLVQINNHSPPSCRRTPALPTPAEPAVARLPQALPCDGAVTLPQSLGTTTGARTSTAKLLEPILASGLTAHSGFLSDGDK